MLFNNNKLQPEVTQELKQQASSMWILNMHLQSHNLEVGIEDESKWMYPNSFIILQQEKARCKADLMNNHMKSCQLANDITRRGQN